MGRCLEGERLGQGGRGAYILLGLGRAPAGFVGPHGCGDGGPAGQWGVGPVKNLCREPCHPGSRQRALCAESKVLSKENFNQK
jgi:hypothetical protein